MRRAAALLALPSGRLLIGVPPPAPPCPGLSSHPVSVPLTQIIMPPRKKKNVVLTDDDEERITPNWVKEIVGEAQGTGGHFLLVMWGSDEEGREYEEGQEEFSWEPYDTMATDAADSVATFWSTCKKPMPDQVKNATPSMIANISPLIRNVLEALKKDTGPSTSASRSSDLPSVEELAAGVKIQAVSDGFPVPYQAGQSLPEEPEPVFDVYTPVVLTPSKEDYSAYDGTPSKMRHDITLQRGVKQLGAAALDFAGTGLVMSPAGSRCAPPAVMLRTAVSNIQTPERSVRSSPLSSRALRVLFDKDDSGDRDRADPDFDPNQVSSQDTEEAEEINESTMDYDEEADSGAEVDDLEELGLTASAREVDRLQAGRTNKNEAYGGARGLGYSEIDIDEDHVRAANIERRSAKEPAAAAAERAEDSDDEVPRARAGGPPPRRAHKSKSAVPPDLHTAHEDVFSEDEDDDEPKGRRSRKTVSSRLTFSYRVALASRRCSKLKDEHFTDAEIAVVERDDLDQGGRDVWIDAIEDALTGTPFGRKHDISTLKMKEFGYYKSKSERIALRNDAVVESLVMELGLIDSKKKAPTFYMVYEEEAVDHEPGASSTFTYDGNHQRDSQEHSQWQLSLDAVFKEMTSTTAKEGGKAIISASSRKEVQLLSYRGPPSTSSTLLHTRSHHHRRT